MGRSCLAIKVLCPSELNSLEQQSVNRIVKPNSSSKRLPNSTRMTHIVCKNAKIKPTKQFYKSLKAKKCQEIKNVSSYIGIRTRLISRSLATDRARAAPGLTAQCTRCARNIYQATLVTSQASKLRTCLHTLTQTMSTRLFRNVVHQFQFPKVKLLKSTRQRLPKSTMKTTSDV